MASLVLIIGGIVLILGGILGSFHYKTLYEVFGGREGGPAEFLLLPMWFAVLIGGLWIASEVFGS